MKKYLIAMVFTLLTAYGQNPDGKFASLHLTPSWQWGNADVDRNTTINLPASLSYPEQLTTNQYSGTVHFPYAFGIHALMKIPATSFLTMCFSYSLNQKFEEDIDYRHYWRINGIIHRVDVTVSMYNLFSVYQGE